MKKKIIIIDDHDLFRDSLRQLIGRSSDYEVIDTAADAKEGENKTMRHRPDIVVVDLSLPDKSGIQLTRILKTVIPDVKVVIVSMHAKIDYVLGALQAGALGYIVKDSVSKTLFDCLKAAMNGNYYLDAALSGEVAAKLLDITTVHIDNNSSYGALSPREQEVMRLLSRGETTETVADKLSISPKTVANHKANIMNKLDIHNSAELVRYAARLGLLDNTF